MGREGNATVLVVDDDQLNRTVLSKLLEHEGYEAKAVTDGVSALEALERDRYDAVLLDIMMPGIDGIQVLQKLKTSSRFWRMPVIMISAVEETESIVRCLELGAEDYVLKPFDPVLLRARINATLARQRFQDLEGEYHKIVEEQALELDRLYRLGRFFPAKVANRSVAGSPDISLDPHRERIAVVVCCLSGYGKVAEALDSPRQALQELSAFHSLVGTLVGSFEGTLGPSDPHSVNVFFNDPVPCPDAAGQAVGMAVRCRDEVSTLIAAWNGNGAVRFGVGVALGDATLGPVGVEPAVDYAAVGDVVDRAQRLCQIAVAEGGVVTDQNTLESVAARLESRALADGHLVVGWRA